tara:strand:- start:775 stop:891 length:117 start_codon:yes stop_codon:yes gene_type:complete
MGLQKGDILKFGRNEEFCILLNGRKIPIKVILVSIEFD